MTNPLFSQYFESRQEDPVENFDNVDWRELMKSAPKAISVESLFGLPPYTDPVPTFDEVNKYMKWMAETGIHAWTAMMTEAKERGLSIYSKEFQTPVDQSLKSSS